MGPTIVPPVGKPGRPGAARQPSGGQLASAASGAAWTIWSGLALMIAPYILCGCQGVRMSGVFGNCRQRVTHRLLIDQAFTNEARHGLVVHAGRLQAADVGMRNSVRTCEATITAA